MKLKILKVEHKEFEEVMTNEIHYLNRYRRLGEMEWERWMGETHQWLSVRFCDEMEEAYQKYMKEQKRNQEDE